MTPQAPIIGADAGAVLGVIALGFVALMALLIWALCRVAADADRRASAFELELRDRDCGAGELAGIELADLAGLELEELGE